MDGLGSFRIWLAGSAGFAARLAPACDLLRLDGPRLPAGPPADCLLVEGAWLSTAGREPAAELLDRAAGRGMPRVLWIRESPFDPAILDLAPRFERVFSVDIHHLGALAEAGFEAPSPLPEATSIAFGDPAADERRRAVEIAWLGGWRRDWPAAWKERLSALLLAAAPHGLRIYGVADPTLLPGEIRDCVVAGGEAGRGTAILRDAKLAIAADPAIGSDGVAPAVAFDAAACGAAAISPHGPGLVAAGFWSLRPGEGIATDLVSIVTADTDAGAEIARLLGDAGARREMVRRCRRLVLHNHTYAHRVATIASAVGVRALPDAPTHPTRD